MRAALAAHVCEDEAEESARERILRFVETHEDCFRRELAVGHVTGSAWVLDPARRRVLLTHHRKLGMWLQLGGHADGEADVAAVALREAREESGLDAIRPLGAAIFDVDVHTIPARGAEPEHLHYDVRYLFEADPDQALRVSGESHDVAWWELEGVGEIATDASVLRMVAKSLRLRPRAG